ncbi:hypothetical protein PENTCL1PPCAC_12236, partial [Pristionchus entomophagus]
GRSSHRRRNDGARRRAGATDSSRPFPTTPREDNQIDNRQGGDAYHRASAPTQLLPPGTARGHQGVDD